MIHTKYFQIMMIELKDIIIFFGHTI